MQYIRYRRRAAIIYKSQRCLCATFDLFLHRDICLALASVCFWSRFSWGNLNGTLSLVVKVFDTRLQITNSLALSLV
eukprot:24091_5